VIGTLAAARTGGLRRPFGSFPLSVAVSGVLIRHLGPSLFFPIAGAVVAVAILGGLTQREFREFGTGRRAGVAECWYHRPFGKKEKAATGCGGGVRYGGRPG
jgi:hypothetical protein